MVNLDLNKRSREELFNLVLPILEDYYSNTKSKKVASDWNIKEVKEYARTFDLEKSNGAELVVKHTLEGLSTLAVHTPHPNYFGLFNPRTSFTSILGDLITATFNSQLAAWSHAPFANEIESYVIQEFGKKVGYEANSIDGTFCTGGAESNLTALLSALNNAFPDFDEFGVRGIKKELAIYCSSESHHSVAKAAKMTGLGNQSVKYISVDADLKMNIDELKKQINIDRQNGIVPLMIVGTGGTTGAGAIDDLEAIAKIAKKEEIWFHVDAAYGGAAVISKKYKSILSGIELSDSITIDLHKWFSIPMGASLFLTSHKKILHQSFNIKTNYMPEDSDPNQIVDPYLHSVQWSRRFIGLKMYLPLAIHGWEGYEQVIDNQFDMGATLKGMLEEARWKIKNNTALPIICFSKEGYASHEMSALVKTINDSGKAWLSIYPIDGEDTGRVCITNYSTGLEELKELIDSLKT